MLNRLQNAVYALFWFGEFRVDCYYCESTLKSRNLAAMVLKRSFHLGFTHDKDPDGLPDDEYESVCDHMGVYAEDMDRSEFVEAYN